MSDPTREPALDGYRAWSETHRLIAGRMSNLLGLPRMQTASEKLGNLVLDLPIGVVVVNRQYDIETINAAAHRLLGISPLAAVGNDLIHLAASVPPALLRAVIDAAFRATSPATIDPASLDMHVITVQTALGEQRDLQIACYPRWVDAEPRVDPMANVPAPARRRPSYRAARSQAQNQVRDRKRDQQTKERVAERVCF